MTKNPPDPRALLTELDPSGAIPLTAISSPNWSEPLKLQSQYTSATLLKPIDQASRSAVAVP